VAVGSADAAASALGTGFVTPGGVQLTVGTGAQAVAMRATASVDHTGRTHLYRAAPEGRWYAMAAVQNAGLALDWARRTLGAEWPAVYAAIPDGALPPDAPLFIPHLTQERPFQAHPGPGAGWVSARLHHRTPDLLAAAVEGIVFGIRLALDALPGVPGSATLRLSGGGGMDPGYRQLLADVLGRDLQLVEGQAASARGAALLGAVAAGWWPSPEAAALAVAPAPGPITHARPTTHRAHEARRAAWLDAVAKVA
jgi:xylulokinase